MGLTVPTKFGGGGRDYVSYALAIEAVSHASATVGVILTVNNSLVAEVVAQFGTDAQRTEWLGRLANGRAIGAFALSEPDAGTDAAHEQTTATHEGGRYVLRGRKVWVANAAAAEVLVMFAATESGVGGRGVSTFLVPADADGLTGGAPLTRWAYVGSGARTSSLTPLGRHRGDDRSAGAGIPHCDVGARRRACRDRGASARCRHGRVRRGPG